MAKFTSRPSKKDPLQVLQSRIDARFRPKVEGIWQRLLRRLHSTVNFVWFKKDTTLTGRIHALNRDAQTITADLRKIYQQLAQEIDPRLFSFVQAIIEPLLKDSEPIAESLHSQNVTVQAKSFQKYSVWVEQARYWIELYQHQLHDKSQIVQAVVKHQIGESIEMIKRDVQVIHDYQEHLITSLPVSDLEKQELHLEMNQAAAVSIQKLLNLTALEGSISLEEVSPWKGVIDKRRQTYFDEALQVIDDLLELHYPEYTSDEAQEHLLEICGQIAYLEEQMPHIQAELEGVDPSDHKDLRMILSRLSSLEETAHRLNLDLRLTPDLADRLEIMIDAVHASKERLEHLLTTRGRKVC